MMSYTHLCAILIYLMMAVGCGVQDSAVTTVTKIDHNFYVGTYTDGDSKGIYQYTLLPDGQMRELGLATASKNPSFLTRSKDNKFLLAVNEVEQGKVESFRITEDSLLLINRSESGGTYPCHITNHENRFVLVANYGSGDIGLLQLNNRGELSESLDVLQHKTDATNTKKAHAHMSLFLYDNNIASVDLGLDEIHLSSLNIQANTIKTNKIIQLDSAAGPRHLCKHPSKDILYVINELQSSVTMIEGRRGTYNISQTISTLPSDYTEPSYCADIHITTDGAYLYASNRGHNSIAIYKVADTGKLTLIGHESVRGDWPRNFALSPDESFLIVANQKSNNIVSFNRNGNGTLTYASEIKAASPTCILF